MAAFVLNDRVRIRSSNITGWRTGTVTSTTALGGSAYEVTLDAAVSANAWSGRARARGGLVMVTKVYFGKNAEALLPGEQLVHLGPP